MLRTQSSVGTSRNAAAQRRNALERRLRGQLNSGIGSTTIIIEIGASLTKVMASSEPTPRAVLRTPPEVAVAMRSAVDYDEAAPAVAPFIHHVCGLAGVCHTNHALIVLFNAVHNRAFERCVVDLVTAYSPLQRVRVLCSQVAALVAHGTTSGCVVDVGFWSSSCLPVVQEVGSQFDAVSSTRGVSSLLTALRNQLYEANPVMAQHRFDRSTLTDTLLLAYVMQNGSVAPAEGHPDRDATLNAQYPLPLKTLMLFGKPNLAIETLFAPTPGDQDDCGADRPVCGLVSAALRRTDALTIRKDAAMCCALVGGITQLPNFRVRFAAETVKHLAADPELARFAASIRMPDLPPGITPTIAAVVGASLLASSK